MMAAAVILAAGRVHPGPVISITPAAIPSNEPPRIRADGRIVCAPDHEVTLSAEIGGVIASLPVKEGGRVRRGETLAQLAGEDHLATAVEAKARVDELTAELAWARHELERQQRLRATGGVTQQILDRARHDHETAGARLEQARAAARRAVVQVERTRILAPRDGTLITRLVDPGEHVTPGTPLLVLADLDSLLVEAEVDEFDAGRVVPGCAARITAEGYPGKVWAGHVTEVPCTVGARRLRPQDPGRPVDTRVLLVKIACPELELLKLGQRVHVSLEAPPGKPDA